MNLYRMTYMRAGLPRRTTFAARDMVAAQELAARWCRRVGVLLSVEKLRALQPQLELRA